jgi:hypothetical protein
MSSMQMTDVAGANELPRVTEFGIARFLAQFLRPVERGRFI